ncbi:haloacid dehalogenase [Karstenula rhodostoma CBS 690.94]|uniref:Haloacid dehalogenase n=1 Tax=Karstenula rhodostoma CBS 690.94 TaxID=1392251 RepID=A0A9P4UBK8_9PLEO|nr:haloacid dehalogenase [Karstenula rhodostoma CBS 690.94]
MSSRTIPLGAPTPLPSLPRIISGVTMALTTPPRALFFDVFGTCVDWRTSVTQALNAQSHAALNSATASLASRVRLKASGMTLAHWADFAQQWRNSYKTFTRKLAADPSVPWKSVDEHHFESLKELLAKWELGGLWSDEEVRALSLVWHRLDPWSDSVQGIALLNRLFWTATLSNGNVSLLSDLKVHSNIPFTHLLSAELFGTYKPSPAVYRGAAEKLGLPVKECVMVAAHLDDLQAAKSHGMQVIYVERPGEEEWSVDEVDKARDAGWVDVWVSLSEGNKGFVTVAEKLGVEPPAGHSRKLSSSA